MKEFKSIACGQCAKNKNERCIIQNDEVNEWIQKMKEADGIIIGSPVHYSGIAGTMKAFLDRAFYVAGVNGSMFRHKAGAYEFYSLKYFYYGTSIDLCKSEGVLFTMKLPTL